MELTPEEKQLIYACRQKQANEAQEALIFKAVTAIEPNDKIEAFDRIYMFVCDGLKQLNNNDGKWPNHWNHFLYEVVMEALFTDIIWQKLTALRRIYEK